MAMTRFPDVVPTTGRTPRPARRGAALLLVLIALAVGLLLVATWLDGRRESVPVARRVAAGAMARQAAASGVDLAAATIDAEEGWRAAHDAGRFDGPFPLSSATCELRLTDAETGERPNDETVTLRVACTATVDEVVATVERTIDVDASMPIVDLAYGETAIVVERQLRIRDDAALLPWTARPGVAEGPLVVGSFDGRPDAVLVEDGAVTLGTELLLVDDRSSPGSADGLRRLPDPLPGIIAPTVPSPDLDGAITSRVRLDLNAPPDSDVLATGVRIPARSTLTIDGDRVIRSLAGIELSDGALLEVTGGTLVLDATQDLLIRGATISVADGASLILRAGREMRLDGAIIVPDTVAPADAASELVSTSIPRDTIVATIHGSNASVTIEGRSAVVMSIVAPEGGVEIRDDAVLHGRILAADVELADRALVYARPDDGQVIGLTTPSGPHREDDGRLIEEARASDRGTGAGLIAAAERIGVPVVLLTAIVEPDPETVARRGQEIRERIRRALEERRRRRGGPRWARAGREFDE
jgi:hypothetical protein